MSAEVSRAIAAFIADMGLGRDAAKVLSEQFADVQNVNDLPDWVTEDADEE